MLIDFHNHYYPPHYLDALQSGESSVKVTIDGDGNPESPLPGRLQRRGARPPRHRLPARRCSTTTASHAGDHVDHARARTSRRRGRPCGWPRWSTTSSGVRSRPRPAVHGAGDAAAQRSGGVGRRTRARHPASSGCAARCCSATSTASALERRAVLAALRGGQRARRGAVHPPDASGGRRDDAGVLADAAGGFSLWTRRWPPRSWCSAACPSGFPNITWALVPPGRGDSRTWPSGSIAASTRSRSAAPESSVRRART